MNSTLKRRINALENKAANIVDPKVRAEVEAYIEEIRAEYNNRWKQGKAYIEETRKTHEEFMDVIDKIASE